MNANIARTSLALIVLTACTSATEPFDPKRCELELETRLVSQLTGEPWKPSDQSYVALNFDVKAGDAELLDKYLRLKGYWPVANDPEDKSMKFRRTFFPHRDPETAPFLADQTIATKIACAASYVSGARLISVNVMVGHEPVIKAELK